MNQPAHRYGVMIGMLAVSLATGCATTTAQKDSPSVDPMVKQTTVNLPTTSKSTVAIAQDSPDTAATIQPTSSTDISDQVQEQEPQTEQKQIAAEPEILDISTKRMILSWATHSLLRAQTMMHGSDDVALIVEAAMDQNETYRSKLADHLAEQGITEKHHEQAMAKIEKHIRSTTRDFVLQARTLLKRENKSMPTTQKADVMI